MDVENTSLAILEPLIGRWTMEVQTRHGSAFGTTTIEWMEGRSFIRIVAENKPDGPPSSISIVGRDQDRVGFDVLYFDRRGVSRTYQMSFVASTWRMWRDQPGFFQRFHARLSQDGNDFSGSWEKSPRGVAWEHDFHIVYRRAE